MKSNECDAIGNAVLSLKHDNVPFDVLVMLTGGSLANSIEPNALLRAIKAAQLGVPGFVAMRAALEKAVAAYGKPGGPWNVPSEPGTWVAMAQDALKLANGDVK